MQEQDYESNGSIVVFSPVSQVYASNAVFLSEVASRKVTGIDFTTCSALGCIGAMCRIRQGLVYQTMQEYYGVLLAQKDVQVAHPSPQAVGSDFLVYR